MRPSKLLPLTLALTAVVCASAHAAEPADLLAKMADNLKLTDAQRPAAAAYLGRIAALEAFASVELLNDAQASSVQRFATVRANIAAELATVKAWRQATVELYAALTPTQRAVWDRFDLYRYVPPDAGRAATAPPTADDYPAAKLLVGGSLPDWVVQPSAAVLARLYPRRGGKGGRAELRCTVTSAGLLRDCAIVSESPQNRGFGQAALIATAYARLSPARRFGSPFPVLVTYPFTFGDVEGEAPLTFSDMPREGTAVTPPQTPSRR